MNHPLRVIAGALAFLAVAGAVLAVGRSRPEALLAVAPALLLMAVPFALMALRAIERWALRQERLAAERLVGLARACLADRMLRPDEVERFYDQEARRALPGALLAALVGGSLLALVALPALGLWAGLIPLLLANLAPRAAAAVGRRNVARMERHHRRVCIGRHGAFVGGCYVGWLDHEAEPPVNLIESVRLETVRAPCLAIAVRSGRGIVAHRLPVPEGRDREALWVANVLRQSAGR